MKMELRKMSKSSRKTVLMTVELWKVNRREMTSKRVGRGPEKPPFPQRGQSLARAGGAWQSKRKAGLGMRPRGLTGGRPGEKLSICPHDSARTLVAEGPSSDGRRRTLASHCTEIPTRAPPCRGIESALKSVRSSRRKAPGRTGGMRRCGPWSAPPAA